MTWLCDYVDDLGDVPGDGLPEVAEAHEPLVDERGFLGVQLLGHFVCLHLLRQAQKSYPQQNSVVRRITSLRMRKYVVFKWFSGDEPWRITNHFLIVRRELLLVNHWIRNQRPICKPPQQFWARKNIHAVNMLSFLISIIDNCSIVEQHSASLSPLVHGEPAASLRNHLSTSIVLIIA